MTATVRSAAVRLTMENASYLRGVNQSATATEVAAGRMQKSVRGAASSTARDFETMGKYGGRAALVVGAGLAAVVKVTSDFTAEMALVRTLSHANATEMDRLSKAALTVGQNIGFSAKEVAQGEEEMVKAGISVKDILGGGLKGALDLAAAGQTDVATATEVAASAMAQFKLKGKDVPHIADLLAAGADKALGSVADLGDALSHSGTTAHQFGLNVDQTVGVLASFAQNGLKGQRSGTILTQMLLMLSKPTSQARKAMKEFGFSAYTATGQLKTMPEIADNLQKSFKHLTPQARNAALGIIFGSRAIQGANILMANGKKVTQEWINKVNDQGFAAHQASGKLDSLTGDVKKFQSTLSTVFIEAGSPTQGALRGLVQGADHLVKDFGKLPGSIQQGVVRTAALTAGVGATLFIVAKIAKAAREIGSIGRGAAAAKGLSGAAGELGGVARMGSPVPVYVTNMGAGGLGAPGEPGAGGTPPVVGPAGGKAPKGAPLGALGLGLGLGFASAGGIVDQKRGPDQVTGKSGSFVIDDKFLQTHVIVDGHWFTKTEWDKQKEASNDALLWLLSGGKKGAPSGRGKTPKALQDPLGPLFHLPSAPKAPAVKPTTLRGDIRGLADILGTPVGGKTPKNPVTKLEASLGLDTGPFDKKASGARRAGAQLNAMKINPKVKVDTGSAMSATAALKSLLDSLHDRNVHINVTKSTNATLGEANAVHPATGGRIVGPGTGTSDSIPAYVSNGEYVIKAAAVDKYGPALFDRLNAMRFASGGPVGTTSYAAGAGITVIFPTPTALAAAVQAADAIAASAAKVDRTAKDIRQQGLDDLHTQQQIRDLQHQLNARNKKHRLELRGLDRKTAQAELADAKANLVEIRNQKKADLEAARQAAIDAQKQARQDATTALTSAGDVFSRGTSPSSAIGSVDRAVADISQYGQIMAQLKSAGASPALLQQLIDRANTGDFRSAIRLGRALLAQPGTLTQLNASLATLGAVSSSVATMTTDPRFLGAGAWAPTSTNLVQVTLAADPSSWMVQMKLTIQHEVEAALARAVK